MRSPHHLVPSHIIWYDVLAVGVAAIRSRHVRACTSLLKPTCVDTDAKGTVSLTWQRLWCAEDGTAAAVRQECALLSFDLRRREAVELRRCDVNSTDAASSHGPFNVVRCPGLHPAPLFVCLSVCLFSCLLACLLVCLLVCLLACLYVCLFVFGVRHTGPVLWSSWLYPLLLLPSSA